VSAATVTAADLGRAAHAAGRMRSPGADAELMRVESEQPTSAAKCAVMAAWLRAYDACVIADLMTCEDDR
jgi:hypothetical protein